MNLFLPELQEGRNCKSEELTMDIPLKASLPGQPNLRRMTVSASNIHRIVKSKDLRQLAQKFLEERTRDWEKRQLRKRFPPPPPPPDRPPCSPPSPPPVAEFETHPSPASPFLEEEDEEEDLQPKRAKFRRIGDEYMMIQESGDASCSVRTIGWQEEAEAEPDSEGIEDSLGQPIWEVVPTPSSESISPSEEAEVGPELPFSTVAPQILPASADNQEPEQLDLSELTPTPIYIPEKQPEHLRPSVVEHTEKTALQCYQEVQEDVKEVVERGGELRDPEEIISARPDGRVTLKDDTKGLVEIKSPSSAQSLTLDEAVRGKKVKFLKAAENALSAQTKYQLKHNDNYYHQVQAEIYAGEEEGFEFCDFVTFLKKTEDISVERIYPDGEWRKKNIPKVREFCKIYNDLLEEKEEEKQEEPDNTF